MFEWITTTVRTFGYVGVAVLTFLENVFPPVPSELIIPLAGFAAAQGDLSLWGVIPNLILLTPGVMIVRRYVQCWNREPAR